MLHHRASSSVTKGDNFESSFWDRCELRPIVLCQLIEIMGKLCIDFRSQPKNVFRCVTLIRADINGNELRINSNQFPNRAPTHGIERAREGLTGHNGKF